MAETVKNNADIVNLVENRIVGNPQLTNTTISFKGFNNLLFCENDVKLTNSSIQFNGNNSIIYLSSTEHEYKAHIFVFHDSTVFIGKDNNISATLRINVQEAQNVIIGDECIFGPDVNIRTSDAFPVFSKDNHKRINPPRSVIIGDHVWLGHLAYVSRGVKLGSGSIVYNNSNVLPQSTVKSNSFYADGQIIADEVFFTDFYTAYFNEEKTKEREYYKSDVFVYEFVENETISMQYIDNVLKEFTIDERLEFLQKLLVRGKRKNRFAIE